MIVTDSIDSDGIYEPTNCQWVHKDINMMKMALTEKDFVQWCDTVSAFQRVRGDNT